MYNNISINHLIYSVIRLFIGNTGFYLTLCGKANKVDILWIEYRQGVAYAIQVTCTVYGQVICNILNS